MTNAGDDRLERVRKLLAKAQGTTNEHEQEAFMEKANALIAEYGIDTALLVNAGEIRDEVSNRFVFMDAPYASEKATLLYQLGQVLGCRVIYNSRQHRSHMFGFTADIDRLEILFTSLLIQANTGLARYTPTDKSGGLILHRKSWLNGFSEKVAERVRLAEERARQQATDNGRVSGTGMELMLVGRKDQVDVVYHAAYPMTQTKTSRSYASSFERGRTAGSMADLGGTRMHGRGRPAVGR